MNSRQLWNQHRRHKFLRAEESRDILKVFRVSEMPFPGVCKRYFNHGRHIVSSEYIENTHKTGNNAIEMSQAFHDITRFEHFTDLNLFIFVQCHSKLANGCFTILFDDAYFLLAVMVEGDESSRLRMPNQPAVLAGYWPLLTALLIPWLVLHNELLLTKFRRRFQYPEYSIAIG